jgi:hypothetical protein
MAGNDAATKFFEAINETSDAVIDAIRAANDRGHRVSAALIEQAQENQREAVELAKKFIAAPLDVPGLYSSMVENATKAQGRALDATRQWFGELAEAQKETREIFQRMVKANRTASEATVETARGLFNRASETLQSSTNQSNGDGRSKTVSRPADIVPAD